MRLVVGHIGRAHGVRGEVVIDVRSDDPQERFVPGAVLATEGAESGPLTVRRTRWHQGRLLVSFVQVPDRTAAEKLRGTVLVVDSTELPGSSEPEEFRDHELLGLAAVTPAGAELGSVVDVVHPNQDLLVMRTPDGGECWVPFVSAIVVDVDVAAGRVVIDPPAGLFDLEERGAEEGG